MMPRAYSAPVRLALTVIGERLKRDELSWDEAVDLRTVVLNEPQHAWPVSLREEMHAVRRLFPQPTITNKSALTERGYPKLNPQQVAVIRRLGKGNFRRLAREFDVEVRTVYRAYRGEGIYE